MAWLDYMSKKLGQSPEFAMRVDEALKKQGGQIKYSGKDPELRKAIEEITKQYRKK